MTEMDPGLRRNGLGDGFVFTANFTWLGAEMLHRAAAPVRRRPGHLLSGLVLGRGAVAADPGIGPIGDLALVLGEERAPGVRLDRLLGLPDDVELPVRL